MSVKLNFVHDEVVHT